MSKRARKLTPTQRWIRKLVLLAMLGFFGSYPLTNQRLVHGTQLLITNSAIVFAVLVPAIPLALKAAVLWYRRPRPGRTEIIDMPTNGASQKAWENFWKRIKALPSGFAVYRFLNSRGTTQPIYIGRAVNVLRRFRQHAGECGEHKRKSWWGEPDQVKIIFYSTIADMKKAEVTAIKVEHPRENKVNNGAWRKRTVAA